MEITKKYGELERIVNNKIWNAVVEANNVCPMCGETRPFVWKSMFGGEKSYGVNVSPFPSTRHGRQKPWYKHIFDKKCRWRTIDFKCYTCGSEWKSEEFPVYEFKTVK